MGPHKQYYANVKDVIKCVSNMDAIDGTIAVDFSAALLYDMVNSDESMLEFLQIPRRNLSSIRPGIERFVENMISKGLKFIFVLDGRPHPKKYASIHRGKESRDAAIELYEILKNPPQQDSWDKIKKLWQKCKILSRPDIHAHVISILKDFNVDFMVAPFEADALVVSLCLQGIAGYAMSTDGDIFVLGAAMVIYGWNFKEGTVNMVCNDLDSHRRLTDNIVLNAKMADDVQRSAFPILVDSY